MSSNGYGQSSGSSGLAELAKFVVDQERESTAQGALQRVSQRDLLRGAKVVLPGENGSAFVADAMLPPRPQVRTGRVELDTVADFVEYLKRYASKDESTVYVNLTYGEATVLEAVAVLDDHGGTPGTAGWKEWRATLKLAMHPQTVRLLKAVRELLSPLSLAELIEDNEDAFYDPPAAELLKVALTLKAAQNSRVLEAHNLANGDVAIEYRTETTASAGADGTLRIPELVTLRLPVFLGEAPQELVMRFRYRVKEGRLMFALVMPGAQNTLRATAEALASKLGKDSPCPVYLGRLAD